MRVLLALLAVLGLLASPLSAAAAQAACSQMTASASMSCMDMPGMAKAHHDGVTKAADPCCDPGKGGSKKSCAQLCAAACAVSAALAGPVVSFPFVMTAAEHDPAPVAPVHSFEPPRPERPPTPIA
jgi:hypothetical protein